MGGGWKYRVDASPDGKTRRTALDKTENNRNREIEFDEIAPVTCRHVRLTVTGGPKGVLPGVIGFTVFGKTPRADAAGKK